MFKKRSHFKLFSILGISLLTSIGVLTGISFGNKGVEKVNAESSDRYCFIPSGWSYDRMHYYGGSNSSSWPGGQLTTVTINGTSYKGYNIRNNNTVILNENGNNQRDPFSVNNNKYNLYDGSSPAKSLSVPENKIYYVDKSSWGTSSRIYGYVGNINNTWPGESLTSVGKKYDNKNIYSYNLPSFFSKIIFSNNGSSQTSDINVATDGSNAYYDGKWFYYDGTTDINTNRTIYFTNTEGWSSVYAHAWNHDLNSDNSSGGWIQATDTGKYYEGSKVYSVTISNVYENIKFSGNNKESGTYYLQLGTGNRMCYNDSVINVPNDPSTTKVKYYLYNIDGIWSGKDIYAYTWQSGLYNEKFPGAKLTPIRNGLYSIEISNSYKNVQFSNGTSGSDNQTGTYPLSGSSTKDGDQCFDLWKSTDITYGNRQGEWNAKGAPYFVSYNANGGSGTLPDTQYPRINGGGISVGSGANLTKNGFTFSGWNTKEDGTGTPYAVGSTLTSNEPGADIVLYAQWQAASVEVTISFDTQGGNKIDPITGNSGDSYTKPDDPTKLNNTFVKWNPSLPDVLPNSDTTYTAQWKLDPGTYLWVKGDASQDGARKMTLNGETGTQYVWHSITLSANDEIRCYYDSGNYGDVNSITWSHPDYKGEKSGNNCKVLVGGTYDIYYDTTSGEMHLTVPTMPENGRGFTIGKQKGDKPLASEVHVAVQWAGWSGTEYKASFPVEKDQYIQAYFQDATKADVYICQLNESTVTGWTYDENLGLKCPENGNYSFYLISKDGGNTYEWISIYKEGEADAVSFAKNFNECISGECSDAGGHTDNLASVWALMAGKSTVEGKLCWGDLSNEAKAYFANGAISISPDIDTCLVKYDHIFTKYYGSEVPSEVLTDFMNRFTDSQGNINLPPRNKNRGFSLTNNGNQSVLIIVISSVSLLTLAGASLLIIKKRKH